MYHSSTSHQPSTNGDLSISQITPHFNKKKRREKKERKEREREREGQRDLSFGIHTPFVVYAFYGYKGSNNLTKGI